MLLTKCQRRRSAPHPCQTTTGTQKGPPCTPSPQRGSRSGYLYPFMTRHLRQIKGEGTGGTHCLSTGLQIRMHPEVWGPEQKGPSLRALPRDGHILSRSGSTAATVRFGDKRALRTSNGAPGPEGRWVMILDVLQNPLEFSPEKDCKMHPSPLAKAT